MRRLPAPTTVFAPSIVYDPDDRWVTADEAPGAPSRAPDLGLRASGVPADLGGRRGALRGRLAGADDEQAALRARRARGPDLRPDRPRRSPRATGRERPLLHVPLGFVHLALVALRRVFGEAVFATWEEAELMEVPMVSARGTADAEALGRGAAGGGRRARRLGLAEQLGLLALELLLCQGARLPQPGQRLELRDPIASPVVGAGRPSRIGCAGCGAGVAKPSNAPVLTAYRRRSPGWSPSPSVVRHASRGRNQAPRGRREGLALPSAGR